MKKKKAKPKSGRGAGPGSLHHPNHHHNHHHHAHRSPPHKKVEVKQYDELPNRFRSSIDPLNLEEEKLKFLKHGQIPHFQFKVTPEKIEELAHTKRAEIEFDLMDAAVQILEKVRHRYGAGNLCVEDMYGERINTKEASQKLCRYLQQNGADGYITVGWTKDQACSAKMVWCGPNMRANRPEARKYSLWVKDSTENQYLREKGILCLADHEIGTHFLRSLNDGLQPWFSCRESFGLRKVRSQQILETEEGLATLNTLVQAKQKYLWIPALIYYTACKAATMKFDELFNHLGHFLENREQRWRYVMRVKRSLPDPAGLGGYGNDQCYFKGAVEILHNLENINFHLLYAGKICIETLPRIQRTARLECIRLPHFLQDQEAYKKTLRVIASLNGLAPKNKPMTSIKERRARERRASSKRRKRGKEKVKVKEQDVAEAVLSDNEDDREQHADVLNESQAEDDVVFQRTYDELAHLSQYQISTEKEEVDGITCLARSRCGTSAATDRPCPDPPIYLGTHPSRPDTVPREASRTLPSQHPPPRSPPEVRCRSQPTCVIPTEEKHPPVKNAFIPASHNHLQSPQRFSKTSPSRIGVKPEGRQSCSSGGVSMQGQSFKWGVAERQESSLVSTMPNVSSRFNREKSSSPVPFSPHRWLLWRRDKRPPNTL